MVKKLTAAGLLTVAFSVGLSSPVQALPVTWTLDGVTFDDGEAATGQFNYDADTNTYSNYEISVVAGSSLPSFTYMAGNSVLNAGSDATRVIFVRDDLTSYLQLSFVSGLTNAGGTVGIDNLHNSSYECANCDPYRLIATGSVTAAAVSVPEPSTLSLFSLALVGLFGISRRRRLIQLYARQETV